MSLGRFVAWFLVAGAALTLAGSDPVLERRKQYLETLQKILPHTTSTELTGRISAVDKSWEDWVQRTGELPPDFDSMPSAPGLPDPPIHSREQWNARRPWIRSQFEQWIYGKMPPAPDNLRAVVTATRREGGVTVREVLLEFGPGRRATLRLQLFVPDGKGPFPVFLTDQPPTHGWIHTAIRRGYIACFYYATDAHYGYPDDSDKFIEIYPEYDFACIARWAWAGMRAVDYLYTLAEVDKAKIGITGHSRNGKQALLAAAFDPRIGAVVASSGTTGESLPWRYTTDIFAVGSIEGITGGPHNTHWFSPRLRFFTGREDRLPVDQNLLLSMVAPRGLMLYAGYAEHEGNPFGYEQAYRSALSVYRLFGHEEKIWLDLRNGEHNTTAGDIENFMNFFDTMFGRKAYPKLETWIYGYTWDGWRRASGEHIDPMRYPQRTTGDFDPGAAREHIRWALGDQPPGLPFQGPSKIPQPPDNVWAIGAPENYLAFLFRRPVARPGMASAVIPFGDGLRADLYYPLANKAGKWPVVVWLHANSYATGYSRYAGPPFESLTRRGFAVLAFDQLGFGTRVLDARHFYDQYPRWSLMGKMVADTRAAIDAISALDTVDTSRIYVVGYGLGAKVGLLTAALDSRVKATAAVCGFEPLRLDTAEKGVEGIRHYSHLHGLLPRLGFFIGQESRLPFDYDEVVALIAPRPVMLVAPTLDRYARVTGVQRELEPLRRVYPQLDLETPLDFNRFTRERQEQVFDWIERAGIH